MSDNKKKAKLTNLIKIDAPLGSTPRARHLRRTVNANIPIPKLNVKPKKSGGGKDK